MNIPLPKYAVGQSVWYASTNSGGHAVQCPDCLGKGVWHCRLPNGEEQNIPCPSCDSACGSIKVWTHQPITQSLTIGSVRLDTASQDPITYMCEETGIGSGQVYYERMLYLTAAEADTAAHALTAQANARSQQQYIDDLLRKRTGTGSRTPGSLVGYLRRKATDLRKQVTQVENHIASLAKEKA